MAFLPNEFHHPQLGEPTDARFGDSMVYVVYTGLEHRLSHYEPGGFPRIWTASAFPPSLWRHRMMVHGTVDKRSIQSNFCCNIPIVSTATCPGPWFIIKMSYHQYTNSHCHIKSKVFYFHNYINIEHTHGGLKPCWVYLSHHLTLTW